MGEELPYMYANNGTGPERLMLQRYQATFVLYGVILPVIAIFGLVGNVVSVVVFLRPMMRSLCTHLLGALLLSHCLNLISIILLTLPMAGLAQYHNYDELAIYADPFLNVVQKIYVGLSVVAHIAQCLIAINNTFLILELYCVHHHPEFLAKHSSSEEAIKIVTIAMNIIILVHIIMFFKHYRRPVLYTANLWEVCLSNIYKGSDIFSNFDKFVVPVLFIGIPWLISIAVLSKTVFDHFTMKEIQRMDLEGQLTRVPQYKIDMIFKSGRSFKIIVAISVVFIINFLIHFAVYLYTVTGHVYFRENLEDCRLIPEQFALANVGTGVVYCMSTVLQSSINFALFFIFGKDFRESLTVCCIKQANAVRDTSRRVCGTLGHALQCRRQKAPLNLPLTPGVQSISQNRRDPHCYTNEGFEEHLSRGATNSFVSTYI